MVGRGRQSIVMLKVQHFARCLRTRGSGRAGKGAAKGTGRNNEGDGTGIVSMEGATAAVTFDLPITKEPKFGAIRG